MRDSRWCIWPARAFERDCGSNGTTGRRVIGRASRIVTGDGPVEGAVRRRASNAGRLVMPVALQRTSQLTSFFAQNRVLALLQSGPPVTWRDSFRHAGLWLRAFLETLHFLQSDRCPGVLFTVCCSYDVFPDSTHPFCFRFPSTSAPLFIFVTFSAVSIETRRNCVPTFFRPSPHFRSYTLLLD